MFWVYPFYGVLPQEHVQPIEHVYNIPQIATQRKWTLSRGAQQVGFGVGTWDKGAMHMEALILSPLIYRHQCRIQLCSAHNYAISYISSTQRQPSPWHIRQNAEIIIPPLVRVHVSEQFGNWFVGCRIFYAIWFWNTRFQFLSDYPLAHLSGKPWWLCLVSWECCWIPTCTGRDMCVWNLPGFNTFMGGE